MVSRRARPFTRNAVVAVAVFCIAIACKEEISLPLIGTLRVTTVTAGSDIDPDGYLLHVGSLPARAIQPNGATEEFQLATGTYPVVLTELAPNCTLLGEGASVTVGSDSLSEVTLEVHCNALPGAVRVLVETLGEDLDLDGYRVVVDGSNWGRVPANGSVVFDTVPAGLRSVALHEVASNCSVMGEDSIVVDVTHPSEVTAEFSLMCEHTSKIAFVDRWEIKTVNQDGSGMFTLLSTGWIRPLDLDWSASGRQIAFSHLRDTVWIMESDGSQLTPLQLGDAHAGEPAWSFDDSRLAIGLWTNYDSVAIYTCDLTGGDLRQVTSGEFRDWAPAWSPDGTQLVFVREYPTSARRLFIVNVDGSGLVQLTDGVDDREPAWAPTGALIAFTGPGPTGERRVYLVQPNGSGRESLLPTDQRIWGYSPNWSADGTELLTSDGNRLYYVDLATRQLTWSFPLGVKDVGVQQISWRP